MNFKKVISIILILMLLPTTTEASSEGTYTVEATFRERTWSQECEFQFNWEPKKMVGNDTITSVRKRGDGHPSSVTGTNYFHQVVWKFGERRNYTHIYVDIYFHDRNLYFNPTAPPVPAHSSYVITVDDYSCGMHLIEQTSGPTNPPENPNPPDPDPTDPPPVGNISGLSTFYENGESYIRWNGYTGATQYRVYQNGEIFTTTGQTTLRVNPNLPYRVEALDSNGNVIGRSGTITSAGRPSEDEGKIENLQIVNDRGRLELVWEHYPNAMYYEVNGERTQYPIIDINDPNGTYEVIAYDQHGNRIASGMITGGNNGGGNDGSCDFCKLASMIECPLWDEYMGQWEDMMRRVIPPPPDWNYVALTFRDTIVPRLISDLSSLLGYAPNAPSESEISSRTRQPQATANQSINIPQPENFRTLDFNISNFEEIEIIDESPNFYFDNPLDIEHSNPRTPVFPADPNNHTGGVKTPSVEREDMPVPEHVPSDIPELPNDPTPTPSDPVGGTPPMPEQPNPAPSEPTEWEPERPYYKDIP